MITIGHCIGYCLLTFVLGALLGMFGMYLNGINKCEHEWEKIIDDKYINAHIVVHMCKKCGKRKRTEA